MYRLIDVALIDFEMEEIKQKLVEFGVVHEEHVNRIVEMKTLLQEREETLERLESKLASVERNRSELVGERNSLERVVHELRNKEQQSSHKERGENETRLERLRNEVQELQIVKTKLETQVDQGQRRVCELEKQLCDKVM
jgi:chromosome segregation ATPase